MPASTKQHAAVFDVIGTLVDLAPARDRLVGIGAPPVALEAWFQRLLHSAATASAIGGFRPFEELARASLRSTLAQLGLDPEHGDEVVGVLSRLPAFPEAAEALDLLRGEGHTVIALTNSGTAQARSLLDANELLDRFDAVVSAEDAGAYKPHRAPYELTLERLGDKRATMIAAHGWDVLGAQAVGLDGIWIDRLERRWPFPFAMPRRAADLLDAAELVLSRDVSPRAAAEGR